MLTRKQEQTDVPEQPSDAPAQDPVAAADPESLLTVTGDDARIEGDFKITDSLHIECEIRGSLEVGGKVVIGEHGIVRADVHTVDALIMGTYEGNMIATGDVEIASTGRVTGNIQTDSLVIEKGGFFNGNVEGIETGEAAQEQDQGFDAKVSEFPSPVPDEDQTAEPHDADAGSAPDRGEDRAFLGEARRTAGERD